MPWADHETPRLKKRLLYSLGFLAVLMYFSMGHMMFGWPLPAWFHGNHVAMGLVQLLLAGVIMVINQKFFISGFTALKNKAPNMDSLVALGSMALLCLECLCPVCHDGCPDAREYGRGHDVYG